MTKDKLNLEISSCSGDIVASVSNLEFIQMAVGEVREFIDEVIHTDGDGELARDALKEVQRKINLIDLAFEATRQTCHRLVSFGFYAFSFDEKGAQLLH